MTLQHWNRLTEWPLTAAALVFLGVYAWDVIGDLHGRLAETADIITWVIWAAFVIDYIVSLTLAKPRLHWFLHHLLDLAIVVLPVFRPLRLLRLVRLVTVLQRAVGTAFRGRLVIYVISSATLLVFIAALAELDAEQNARGSNIRDFGDSVWWACVTIASVGYGDYYPVTPEGKVVAVGLMIAGLALLGSVTALLASWFIEQINRNRVEQEVAEVEATVIDDLRSGDLEDEARAERADPVPDQPATSS